MQQSTQILNQPTRIHALLAGDHLHTDVPIEVVLEPLEVQLQHRWEAGVQVPEFSILRGATRISHHWIHKRSQTS